MNPKSRRYYRYFTYIEPVLRIPLVKTYGFIIVTIVALIVFIVFAIKPTLETIAVLQKELQIQKETLEKITQKSKDLGLARESYQKLDPFVISKISAAVPDSVQLASLVRALERSATQNSASISAIQFEPINVSSKASTSSTKLGDIKFTFNTEGSYDILKKILHDLSQNPRIISIDNLVFNKANQSNILLMSVAGKAYYLQ